MARYLRKGRNQRKIVLLTRFPPLKQIVWLKPHNTSISPGLMFDYGNFLHFLLGRKIVGFLTGLSTRLLFEAVSATLHLFVYEEKVYRRCSVEDFSEKRSGTSNRIYLGTLLPQYILMQNFNCLTSE